MLGVGLVDSSILNPKNKGGLAPLSVEVFNGTSSLAATPVANTLRNGPLERSIDWSSTSELGDSKLCDLKPNGSKLGDLKPNDPKLELSDPETGLV